MEVIFEKEIVLQKSESPAQIEIALLYVITARKMIFEVLMPLAAEEEGIFDLFEELDERRLMGVDEDVERDLHLQDNLLKVTLSQGPELTEHIQSLYN